MALNDLHKYAKGADLHISRINMGTGTPTGSIIPSIDGEAYYCLTNNTWYIAKGLTANDWVEDKTGQLNNLLTDDKSNIVNAINWLKNLTDTKANDVDVVHKIGDENIDGIKTFTSIPILPDVNPTNQNESTRKKYVDDGLALKANDSNTVHKTGNEVISGVKTFNDTPIFQNGVTINGGATEVNTTNLSITDNEIILNNGETGNGVSLGYSGIRIKRGGVNHDFLIRFDELDDSVKIGFDGQELKKVAVLYTQNTQPSTFDGLWIYKS